jgi:hypothetical protein
VCMDWILEFKIRTKGEYSGFLNLAFRFFLFKN